MDDWGIGGSIPGRGEKRISSAHRSDPHCGPPKATKQYRRATIPGVKRPDREAHYSPPYSAELKHAWGFRSSCPFAFIAWSVIKQRDSPCLHTRTSPSIIPTEWTSHVCDKTSFTQHSPSIKGNSCPPSQKIPRTNRSAQAAGSVTTLHFT